MKQDLYSKAETFIRSCYEELEKSNEETGDRLKQIKDEITLTGTYLHTYEELEHGAKMAWRNSNRCIGRLFWETLTVFDHRNLTEEDQIKDALFAHIQFATNEGQIRPAISIFRQKEEEHQIRLWNHQLIRYAGYETATGIVGDPQSIAFTKKCEKMGWRGERTRFDVLPLIIQVDEKEPKLYEVDKNLVLEIPLRHPEYSWFEDLDLKWYAVPFISDMKLEIGGIEYTTAPFNGWYMGTEIGARNLADEFRYNLLPVIADQLGLNRKKNSTLWKDRALIELNTSVLYSFNENRVTIVDHHTAALQFKVFEQKEEDAGRDVKGDWTWLIPPVSPATTHIFHKSYENDAVTPNYFYQDKPYS